MAGLLSSAEADPMAAQAPPAADSAQSSDEAGEQPNVTPEEQQQYDAFVENGLKVIYTDGTDGADPAPRPDVINRLKESSDPIENLANATVWLVTMLETSAEQGGQQLEDAVVMHAGQALLEELAEVSEAAKIHDYSQDELDGAWYKGLDLYRETATESGRIDPEALKQQFGEIESADQQGRMGDVLPQLGSEADGKMPQPPQAVQQE